MLSSSRRSIQRIKAKVGSANEQVKELQSVVASLDKVRSFELYIAHTSQLISLESIPIGMVEQDLTCGVCKLVLSNPHVYIKSFISDLFSMLIIIHHVSSLGACGHVFCHRCILDWFSVGSSSTLR